MTYPKTNKPDQIRDDPKYSRRYTDTHSERRRQSADGPADPEQQRLDHKLDAALQETFPASDPVQLTTESERE